MDVETTDSGAQPDIGYDLLIDGSPAYTMLQAPFSTPGNNQYFPQSWHIFPSVVSAGANSTIGVNFSAAYNGSTSNTGTRIQNGTGPLTSFNLGTTHTIGLRMECSSATGVSTTELFTIKVVRK